MGDCLGCDPGFDKTVQYLTENSIAKQSCYPYTGVHSYANCVQNSCSGVSMGGNHHANTGSGALSVDANGTPGLIFVGDGDFFHKHYIQSVNFESLKKSVFTQPT